MTEISVYGAKAQLAPWWLVFLEGLAALIIGIYLAISPVSTTISLVWILGIYWFVTGILTLVYLFADRTDMIWKLISGIIGILAGLAVIEYPLLSAFIVPATFVIMVGIFGICYGAICLFYSFKFGWGAAIMGILSIVFGLLLLGSPYMGVVLLVYSLAGLGIAGGVATMILAFKMRSM